MEQWAPLVMLGIAGLAAVPLFFKWKKRQAPPEPSAYDKLMSLKGTGPFADRPTDSPSRDSGESTGS